MKHPSLYAALALLAGAYPGTFVAIAQSTDSAEPIELFAKLMPVITHPRCMGCHGAVNPFSGDTHGGGEIDVSFDWQRIDMNDGSQNKVCLECHIAGVTETIVVPGPNGLAIKTGKWRLAPKHLAFVGKSTKDLCKQFANFARLQSHLERDELIGLAFAGRRGDATTTSHPPPLPRGQFVHEADVWLDKGHGRCGGWEGEITQTEVFESNYSYPWAGADGTVAVKERATREVKITRVAGRNTGTFKMNGSQTMVKTMHLVGENGPCTTVLTANSDWRSTPLASTDISVRVQLAQRGDYTIHFSGPAERTVTRESGQMVNDCGITWPVFPQDPPSELAWPHWAYTIRCPNDYGICQMFDEDNGMISGTTEQTVIGASDAVERQSWLNESPVGTSRADDGTPIPVKVKTVWNLTLKD